MWGVNYVLLEDGSGNVLLENDDGFDWLDKVLLENWIRITNVNAEEFASNYTICDKSGWRVYPGTLKQEYTGMLVREELHELRHGQEYERSRGGDKAPGSPRLELDDTFIDNDDPVTI